MCFLCVYTGKNAGGPECSEVGSQSTDFDAGNINAALPPGGSGADAEAAGSDAVAGGTSTSNTLSTDGSVRGFVNTAGDQDWYRVNLVAGQQYTFALNGFGQGAMSDPYMRLFNGAGTEIGANDDGGPINASMLTYT